LGTWLAGLAGLPDLFVIELDEDTAFPVIWSIIGGALFAALLALISRGGQSR
jgi:hypothetical protein